MSIAFTPVPVRARRDGWTPERQHAFIAALATTRCIAAAARAVGMSYQTAYRLRARPDAQSFAAAWDAALAGPDLTLPVSGRAVGGMPSPVTYRGRQVGERRRYDDRLACYLLAIRIPEHYGRAAAQAGRRPVPRLAQGGATACAGSDFSHNVAPTSSPSAPARSRRNRAASLARALPLGPCHAHRRHPALRRTEHLRPPPARRDPVQPRL